MFRSLASGVSAAAGYNGLPQTVAENVMPIEKIKWSDAVVNKFQVLVIPLLSLIIAVLMPITSPLLLAKGPPLLPGLIEASV